MSLFTFNEDYKAFNEFGDSMSHLDAIAYAGGEGEGGKVDGRRLQKGLNMAMDNTVAKPAEHVTVLSKACKKAADTGDYSDLDKIVSATENSVKKCENQSWLEKTKAKLEAKIKEYDNKFKQMEEENKKNGGSSISNKFKYAFTKIKQVLLKVIKAIVSALASIQNKFRSKKESK
jgi:hypothetical protein